MIAYALLYKTEVEKRLAEFEATPAAMYFAPYPYFEPTKLTENTWNKLQLVSVHDGEIKGFLSAMIDRNTNGVTGISLAKFCEGHDLEFASEVATVFRFLLAHFRFVRFGCASGCPTLGMYEKISREFDGHECSRLTNEYRLRDGEFNDAIFWEIMGSKQPDGLTDINIF